MKDQVNIAQNSSRATLPVIAGVEITADVEGRFNLNSLHKASGAERHKSPSEWLRYAQVKELVREMTDAGIHGSPINVLKGGVIQGTFVHELLAISYAGWISPRFQLQVNQAFLDSKRSRRPEFTDVELLEMALDAAREREALKLVNQEQANEIRDLKTFFKDGLTSPQFARMLNGVNVKQINKLLVAIGWIYPVRGKNGHYRVSSYARDKYMTEKESVISPHGHEPFVISTPILLTKGAEKLYGLYRKSKLPMKLSWDGSYTHLKFDRYQVAA